MSNFIPGPPVAPPQFTRVTGFPARSIPPSIALHAIFLSTIVLLRHAPELRDPPRVHAEVQHIISLPPPPALTVLPALDSASSGSSGPSSSGDNGEHGMVSSAERATDSAPQSARVLFAGSQHIVSEAPDPTNSVQTILQPDSLHKEMLPAPIPVPSVVKLAPAKLPPSPIAPALPSTVRMASFADPTPAPARPLALPQHADVDTSSITTTATLAESPRLPQLLSSAHAYTAPPEPPTAPAAAMPKAAVAKAAVATPPQSSATPAQQSASGHESKNLLVVNAVPVEDASLQKLLPEREIHGRFEVISAAPEPVDSRGNTSPTPADSGSANAKSNGKGRVSPHTGVNSPHAGKGGSGTRSLNGNADSGNGTGRDISGAGGGASRNASAHGSGAGSGAAGKPGGLSGGATGSGSGAKEGSANGTSAAIPGGGGNSSSPFGGIMITGGVAGSASASAITPAPPAKHESYGMTIISGARSGGGMRDFGVFNDGPTYTVYLDVSSIGIRGARWSLQYSATQAVRLAHPGTILSPPYPAEQQLPHLPAAAIAGNIGRMLVVRGDISEDGTLHSLQVLQSPDTRLNQALTECLGHWTFQAATMGSDRVPVKALFGIPIVEVMAEDSTPQQQSN